MSVQNASETGFMNTGETAENATGQEKQKAISDIRLILFFLGHIQALHKTHRMTDTHYHAMVSDLYWRCA